ncbi:MAG: PIN domain-containing protein [Planctomycetes bacterium]|nr:PIN domain-containing protein [Planctomycetota bacterium]
MRLRAVLDANVLYPMTLRDTLLRCAEKGWYMVLWTKEILNEATRNLVADGVMTEEQAAWLTECMQEAFEDALVEGHEPLIASMPNDEKDRHVAAAAVHADADLIVTQNTKDFKKLPGGLEVQRPVSFLTDLLEQHGDAMIELLKKQAGDMKKGSTSLDQLLDGLAKTVPGFVDEVRRRLKK